MIFFRFLFSISFLLLSVNAFATHIIGGEITYEFLSANTYKVKLILYKDCQPYTNPNGTTTVPAGFPNIVGQPLISPGMNFAEIKMLYNSGQDSISYNFTNAVIEPIPIINPDPCSEFVEEYCIEKGTYTATITIPPISSGGYILTYQDCCRNPSSINVNVNPANTGIVIKNWIPSNNNTYQNSSPIFNDLPPLAVCINTPIDFSSQVSDVNGDSVVYSLANPLVTSTSNPYGWVYPPFNTLQYKVGYNSSYQIDANPSLDIDQNGQLTGTPTEFGEYIIGIQVKEYRNGILMSDMIRDFRMLIFDCIQFSADFDFEDQICTGTKTVDFLIETDDSVEVLWDFGDLNTSTDHSNLDSTEYTYPETGEYNVTLITNYKNVCKDTVIKTVQIKDGIDFNIVSDSFQCYNNNSYNFELINQDFSSTATIEWIFDEPNLNTVNQTYLQDIHFENTGQKIVKVIVTDNSCVLEKSIQIYISEPISVLLPDKIEECGNGEIIIDPEIEGEIIAYEWFVNNIFYSTEEVFKFQTNVDTNIDVNLVFKDKNNCIDSVKMQEGLFIYKQPNALFSIDKSDIQMFDTVNIINNATDYSSIYYQVNGEIFEEEEFEYIFEEEGEYTITQYVDYLDKCTDEFSLKIIVQQNFAIKFPNTFTPNGDGVNEFFFPRTRNISQYTMIIYDRWGQVVYNGYEFKKEHKWDGKTQKELATSQRFFTVISEYSTINGDIYTYKGVVLRLK